MDPLHLSQHLSRGFNAEIEEIRRGVLAMGGVVEAQLGAALRAMIEGIAPAAAEVAERERRINAAEVTLDEQCTSILARRHPTASDLRLVLTVMKMINDLERIGDEVKRVARKVDRIASGEDRADAELAELADLARRMLHDALDAFARLDEPLALETMRSDARIDAVWKRLQAAVVERMQREPERIPADLDRLWCARSFERIGDRCKNLCEFVLYLIRGEDVRHSGLARTPD